MVITLWHTCFAENIILYILLKEVIFILIFTFLANFSVRLFLLFEFVLKINLLEEHFKINASDIGGEQRLAALMTAL